MPDLQSRRASVVLLALCFVAVLGISLASYLALASRSMQISNRAVKQGQAEQLAELGIEEGLRAMNLNLFSGADTNATLADWSSGGTSVGWTLDTTNKRARATMSFPAGKFGTGITATVKIRIDNYDAGSLDSAYNASTNYRPGNLVGSGGLWYLSNSIHSGKTPSTTSGYWNQEQSFATVSNAPNTITWQSGASYLAGAMVSRNGFQYRCILANTASSSNRPPNATYWISLPYVTFGSDLQYVNDSMVWWTNTTWYRYSGGSWYTTGAGMPPRWFYSAGTTYYPGDMVLSGTTWYRYINSTASSGYALSNTTYWNTATAAMSTASAYWNWDSAQTYNIGDNVYHSTTSSWYRCRIANSNQTPSSSSTYWANTPVLSQEWDANRQYNQNDVVRFNGTWYLSRTNSNFGNKPLDPSTGATNWHSSDLAAQQWSASTAYAVNAYRSYGGVWYRCLVANTGFSPNNTTYWTPTWAQGAGTTTGGPVVYAEATVNFADGTSSITQYRAALGRNPLFPNALAATTTLTLGGSATNVFSYESTTDSGAATEGYAAVLAAGTASTSGTSGLLTISSSTTTVKGYLAAQAASTGYTPRVSYPANAVLLPSSGSAVSPAPTAINVDLTRISGSPYIPQFGIQSVPSYSSSTLSGVDSPTTLGTAGGATPQVVTCTSGLTMDDANDILTIVGPVVLNVQGELLITSSTSAKIIIAETGSLRIHVSGRLRLDSSGGGIENQTLDPKKCVILSNATSNDHNFSTTQAFYGAIYMPGEDLTIDATTATIYGAVSARAISVTGNLNLRYDTSLRGADLGGVDRPWAVTEWRQLTGSTNLATMP